MQIHPLTQVGYVLGGFVRHTGDVVLVNQHRGGALAIKRKFLNVDHCAICNSAHVVDKHAPFALQFFRVLGLAPEEEISSNGGDAADRQQTVKTKEIHKLRGREEAAS